MILQKWSASIPDYPTEVKVSEKRRAVYWTQQDRIDLKVPKKYRNLHDFIPDKDGILIDRATKEKLVANPLIAGTPRMLPINAQKIYVGIHHSVRSIIVNNLHTLFHDAFKTQFPAKIVLGPHKILIGLHFHDVYTTKLPDLDNLASLFVKCGIDCLTDETNTKQVHPHKLGILPDDKLIFIPHIFFEYTPVDDKAKRKLDFNIYLVDENFSIEKALDNLLTCKTGTITQP